MNNLIKNLFIVLLVYIATQYNLYAQQSNNWYFGSAAGFANTGLRIDFSSGSPVVSTCYPLETEEGSSSISDSITGSPLFYTDGVTVWDGTTNAIVTGGTGLKGGSSTTQSAIIMPVSGAGKWLIFTSAPFGGANGINYYTVTGSPGSFTVSAATNLVAGGTVLEGMTVIGSTKGGSSAYWLIVRDQGSTGQVRAFEVNNSGVVNTTPVLSTLDDGSGTWTQVTTGTQGTIKANTCQNQLAFTYLNTQADLTGFDTSTGKVTATAKRIPVAGGTSYGIEFSPNDQYLFLTSLSGKTLYRYTISSGALTTMGTSAGDAGQLQLGPDGVIYMANNTGASAPSYLGTITNPDGGGTFTGNGLLLTNVKCGGNTGFSYWGLPTFPKALTVTNPTITKPDTTICQGVTLTFDYLYAGSVGAGPTDFQWTFEDPAITTSTATNPSHTYNTIGGPYKVKLYINDLCGRLWKDSMYVTVVSPKTPEGTVTCGSNYITLTATGSPSSDYPNYVWYNGNVSSGKVIGIGSSSNYTVGNNNSNLPSSICIGVASSAPSQTSSLNKSIASSNTLPGASETMPKVSPTFDVLADVLVLKSFNIGFRFAVAAPGYPITVTIKQGATTVYANTYNTGAQSAATSFAVPVNTSLSKGTGYTITLTSTTAGIELQRGSWSGATNAGEITYNGESSPGTTSVANLVYDAYTYSVSSACTSPTCITPACTLPVKFLTFDGTFTNGTVLISWSTTSEINNSYFEVQHSKDGESFETIGTINGNGTTKDMNNYYFQDQHALNGINYYRLVQHDYNGNTSVSHVISVNVLQHTIIEAYPNPSTNQFKVVIHNTTKGGTVTVFDIVGRQVFEELISEDQEIILGERWIKGNYILKFTSDSDSKTIHLVKE